MGERVVDVGGGEFFEVADAVEDGGDALAECERRGALVGGDGVGEPFGGVLVEPRERVGGDAPVPGGRPECRFRPMR